MSAAPRRSSMLLALALVACAPAPAPPSAPTMPTTDAEPLTPAEIEVLLEGDYTRLGGTWTSEYGEVQLMFDDLDFTGIYARGDFTGHVDVERGALVFEWADDTSVGRGEWMILDEDTLRGSWGLDTSATNGGVWTLAR